uniref:Uncharacterized protein n=1 Tax=Cucumis melo TaxID=3656 RepID=A0A9I9EC43_CUCME
IGLVGRRQIRLVGLGGRLGLASAENWAWRPWKNRASPASRPWKNRPLATSGGFVCGRIGTQSRVAGFASAEEPKALTPCRRLCVCRRMKLVVVVGRGRPALRWRKNGQTASRVWGCEWREKLGI